MSCAGRPLKARHRRGFMDKAKVGKGSSLTSVFQQTEFTLGVHYSGFICDNVRVYR